MYYYVSWYHIETDLSLNSLCFLSLEHQEVMSLFSSLSYKHLLTIYTAGVDEVAIV